MAKIATCTGNKKKSRGSRKMRVNRHRIKTIKRKNKTIKRKNLRKRAGGHITDIISNIKEANYVDQLTPYVDTFLGQNNGKSNNIYSDHVQLQRKIDDHLNVFTNNCSFVLTSWADTKKKCK